MAHLVVFPNFPNEVSERLVHVNPLLGRCLDELAPEVLGEIAALCAQFSMMETASRRLCTDRSCQPDARTPNHTCSQQ